MAMNNISALDFIILTLAAYRLTHLIVFDRIFEPIRRLFVVRYFGEGHYILQGGVVRSFIGRIMVCHWCTGVWVSVALVIGWMFTTVTFGICLALAVSALLSLIETVWEKAVGVPELVEYQVYDE
jgi:hypothetical protein